MVQVTVCGRRQLERTEANIVEFLVVDAEGLVSVLDKLVDGQRRVVRFRYVVRLVYSEEPNTLKHSWIYLLNLNLINLNF